MDWYNNKRIILTGATSGIGRLLLDKLLNSGAIVVAVGRNIESLPLHDRVFPFQCDVSLPENVDALFEFATSRLGEIDIFFANAGFGYCERLTEPDWDHIDSIFRTNVYSPIYALEKMMKHCKSREFSYVMTVSGVAQTPLAGFSLYTSTKFALDGFVQTMQLELPKNAHLSAVYPVALKTQFFDRSAEGAPLPMFQQSVETTVNAIFKGVARKKKYIRPMLMFNLSVWFIRVFPSFGRWAIKMNSCVFKKWDAKRKKEI